MVREVGPPTHQYSPLPPEQDQPPLGASLLARMGAPFKKEPESLKNRVQAEKQTPQDKALAKRFPDLARGSLRKE
ncbi:MAG: hypothetical protein K9M07_06195 [Simkaniaceae bacterium]|nr:hypothetical protein [Simkaniaceae bacterium]